MRIFPADVDPAELPDGQPHMMPQAMVTGAPTVMVSARNPQFGPTVVKRSETEKAGISRNDLPRPKQRPGPTAGNRSHYRL